MIALACILPTLAELLSLDSVSRDRQTELAGTDPRQALQRRGYEHGESSCPPRSQDAIHLSRPVPFQHEQSCGDLEWRGTYCKASRVGRSYGLSCVKDWFAIINGRERDPTQPRDHYRNVPKDLKTLALARGLTNQKGGPIWRYYETYEIIGYCPGKTYCLQLDGAPLGVPEWTPKSRRPMPRIACVEKAQVADMFQLANLDKTVYKEQKKLKLALAALDEAEAAEAEALKVFQTKPMPENAVAYRAAEEVRLNAALNVMAHEIAIEEARDRREGIRVSLPTGFGRPDDEIPGQAPWPVSTGREDEHPPFDNSWQQDEYFASMLASVWDDIAAVSQAAAMGQLELVYPPYNPPDCGGKH